MTLSTDYGVAGSSGSWHDRRGPAVWDCYKRRIEGSKKIMSHNTYFETHFELNCGTMVAARLGVL